MLQSSETIHPLFLSAIPGIEPGPFNPGIPGGEPGGEPDFDPDPDPDPDPVEPGVGNPGTDPGYPEPSSPSPVFN